jgi:phosphohistidine phosphatase
MKEIGRALESIGVRPERIVSSPLPRALRTAEIVAEALGHDEAVETDDALRTGRSAEAIRDWLLARREERLMIVGHNPALSDLIGLLVAGRSDLPLCDLRKGGVAALEGAPQSTMSIDWLARPKLLRAIED